MQPFNYIDNQRRVNMRHTNNCIDTPTEEAITYAKWLIGEVEGMGLPTGSILDAGCRTGYTLPILAKGFGRVAGCDIVPEFVAIAGTRGEAHEGDIHALPFQDQEFDWAFCTGTLEHCYDTSKAVSELFRVSRVGVFLTADMQSKENFDRNPSHYVRHDSPEEWLDLIRHPDWNIASLEVPSAGYIHGIWLRKPNLSKLARGLSWYR